MQISSTEAKQETTNRQILDSKKQKKTSNFNY